MKIALDDMIIDPQPHKYRFVNGPPSRIGDQAYIRIERLFDPFEVPVILLKDKSGRKWLVSCGKLHYPMRELPRLTWPRHPPFP